MTATRLSVIEIVSNLLPSMPTRFTRDDVLNAWPMGLTVNKVVVSGALCVLAKQQRIKLLERNGVGRKFHVWTYQRPPEPKLSPGETNWNLFKANRHPLFNPTKP